VRAPVAVQRAPSPTPAALPRPVASASGWTLVPRAAWGAAPLKGNHDPMGSIERITLHHTDEHAGMHGRSDLEVVQAIQAYHRDSLGWADIGYHFLIGRDGRVYEGRAITAQGAHSGGANNRNNLGVSVIGNFSCGLPPAAQLQAVTAFLADRRAAYGLSNAALLGHRDFGPTECPGNALYAWLQDQKRRIA
jgi:N-acetylmuramoyl-L-alanine amidase